MSGFAFRPIERRDFLLLAGWLRQPHVARWWADDASPEGLEADYGGSIDGTEPCEVFIASLEGRALGLAQRLRLAAYPHYERELARVTEVPAGAFSIDYLLGEPDVLRQGLGTRLVADFTADLWCAHADAGAVLVPVHAGNRASWRALERAGYRRVAAGELAPDNPIDSREHLILRIDRPPA